MKTISLEDFAKLDKSTVKLIDVRTAVEFRTQHIESAENIPLDNIKEANLPGSEFYLICKSGMRAKKAAGILSARGLKNFTLITGGGIDQCDTKQFNLVKGKAGMSLERQVRIAAGSLVLTGSLLTLFLHPHFIALPLFVGTGLIFAGITDFCGMGLLLAKMPWNR